MRISVIVACGALFLGFATVSPAQVARQRIAAEGTICKSAMGVPKWGADRTVNNYGERGDLILLAAEAKPSERLVVGAYLYYRSVKQQETDWVDTSPWTAAPPSSLGQEWGYRSSSLNSVGTWTRFQSGANGEPSQNIQLFLPYAAIGLPKGAYRFRYRIRVWSGQAIVDDFYTNEQRIARVAGTEQYRELNALCASVSGPATCQFRLLGTDDEDLLSPIPE